MKLGVILDGQTVVSAEIDLPFLVRATGMTPEGNAEPFSTPAAVCHMRELLSILGCPGDTILEALADNCDGVLSLSEARDILFRIEGDWFHDLENLVGFTTQTFRDILKNQDARLFEWTTCFEVGSSDNAYECGISIDGPALTALRHVTCV